MRARTLGIVASLSLLVPPLPAREASPEVLADGGRAAEPREPQELAAFPGFEPGREIRYVLEGEDGLARALQSVWSIRLTGIEESGVGVFDLNHRFGDFGPGYGGAGGPGTSARAWIDPHGFPLRVEITRGWGAVGSDPSGGVIEYRFEDGHYIKELRADQLREEQGIGLPEHPGLDPGVPRGLYLFMPLGADCLVETVSARAGSVQGRGPGAGPSGGAGGEDDGPPCRGREIVFANPGLLSLTMPALWEAGTGEHDFAYLAPTGLDPSALASAGRRPGGTNFSVGGVPLGDLLFGPDIFGDAEDAFGTFRLAAEGGLVDLDLGGWTESAWEFDAPEPVDVVWVDGSGGIVRQDLASDPETDRRLSIRRLRPSEY